MQGPYNFTPGRDNIPLSDKWNLGLFEYTGTLLQPSSAGFGGVAIPGCLRWPSTCT